MSAIGNSIINALAAQGNTKAIEASIKGDYAKGVYRQYGVVRSNAELRSRQTIYVQELLSEGVIKGLAGEPFRSIFFDNTPIQTPTGANNYQGFTYEMRYGTHNQEPITSFPNTRATFGVSSELKQDQPFLRTVTSASVDGVIINLRFPNGIYEVTNKNKHYGQIVIIAIDVQKQGGAWVTLPDYWVINGKSNKTYDESFRIEKPGADAGLWSYRLRRLTKDAGPDGGGQFITNTTVQSVVEVEDRQVPYPDAAILGFKLDATATAETVPSRQYILDGIICNVPSNYTPTTFDVDGNVTQYAHYTGVWDGTWKKEWTNCPQLILLDLVTNDRYGFGAVIDANDIDLYEVYENSVYCAGLIPRDADNPGIMVPRITFNGSVVERRDAYNVISSVAATSRTVVIATDNKIRFVMDRPKAVTHYISNSDVNDGIFSYSSTPLESRTTAFNVSFYDQNVNYNPVTVAETTTQANIDKYGLIISDLKPLGVTNEWEARRLAKWALDAQMTAYDTVSFVSGWRLATARVGDIIAISDRDYSGIEVAGQLVGTGNGVNSITFDQPFTLTAGTEVNWMTYDGISQTRVIAVSGTDTDTYTLVAKAGALNPNLFPNAPFYINEPVVPRTFRIISYSIDDEMSISFTAEQYDAAKYARIEEGIELEPPLVSMFGGSYIEPVTGLTHEFEAYEDLNGFTRTRLVLTWDLPPDSKTLSYEVQMRVNRDKYQIFDNIRVNRFEIDINNVGIYEYFVTVRNVRGIQSQPVSGYIIVDSTDGSGVAAPTNFRLNGSTSVNTFTGHQFELSWDAVNLNSVKEYQLALHETDGSSPIVHRINLTDTSISITRDDIIRWMGAANRSLTFSLATIDLLNRVGNAVVKTVSNPAPAALTGVALTPFFQQYMIEHNQPVGSDVVGIVAYHSTISGFTPSSSNKVLDDVGTMHIIAGEEDTTYYVRIAAYDDWSDLGLDYGTQYFVTTTSNTIGIIPDPPSAFSASSALVETAPGVWQAKVTLTWTRSPNVNSYDLEILSPSIGYAEFPTVSQPDSGTVTYSFITKPATAFTFRIRARAANSVTTWSTVVNHTTAADSTPPGVPTSLAGTSGFNSTTITWINPNDSDLAGIEINRRTGGSGSGSVIGTTGSLTNFFVDDGLTSGTAYQYRIRAFDTSGNYSGYTSWVAVTADGIPAGSVTTTTIADNAITTPKIVAGAIVTSHMTANTINGNVIQAGTLNANKLVANSITATQIAANTITSGEINANSVRTAILTANSIKTVMIDASQITSTHIGSNTIITNSANIANTVIGTAHIANGAIETAKIANLAVTSAKVSDLQSDNFVDQTSGWRIQKSGIFQLNGSGAGGRTILRAGGLHMYDSSNNLRIMIAIA